MSTRPQNSMDAMTDLALQSGIRCAERPFGPRPNAALVARATGAPVLDVVVPVYNEQAALADSVHRLHRYLSESVPFPAWITIADNASVDDTPRIAAELAAELSGVRVVRLEEKGRDARCTGCGRNRTPRCSSTWTSTYRLTWPRSRHWWRR